MTHDIDDDLNLHPSMIMENPNLVRIRRGQEISLSKIDPTIREITIGAGWDLRAFEGNPVDVDVSVFLLDKNDRTREDEDFIFYNNLAGREGAVKHLGDSRTGAGDGDDENVAVDLMALPFEVVKIAFVMSVYDPHQEHDFSAVKNLYFRVVNNETGHEMFRFEMDTDSHKGSALSIGFFERLGSEWVYKAQGDVVDGGLAKIARDFGIVVAEDVRS